MDKRTAEHGNDIRAHRTSNSLVVHVEKKGHLPNWQGTEVLHQGGSKKIRSYDRGCAHNDDGFHQPSRWIHLSGKSTGEIGGRLRGLMPRTTNQEGKFPGTLRDDPPVLDISWCSDLMYSLFENGSVETLER